MARRSRWAWALVAILAIAGLGVAAYYLLGQGSQHPSGSGPAEELAWPLTGEEAGKDAKLDARVLSVKIDNLAAARPQSGLADADVVYEIEAEGGITRFHAIYHSAMPKLVGPVRSARPPDIRLVQLYDSILLFSGANGQVLAMMEQSGIQTLDETDAGRAFERSAQRSAPHNLYADLPVARQVADERGYEPLVNPPTLQFGDPSVEASQALEVNVPITGSNQAAWRWNGARYERELNGEPHGDEDADAPYTADNVVLLFADVQAGDRPGTTDVLLDGSGDAVLFRDGKRYEATWTSAERSPLRLAAAGGSDLPLAVGNTWVEVLPTEERARFEP